jgi:hypothetical protein
MSYSFTTSTPTTDIYRATVRNSSGMIIEQIVRVPTGQAWQVKQIIEGQFGAGSLLGQAPIGNE